jgi:hypothetical protein
VVELVGDERDRLIAPALEASDVLVGLLGVRADAQAVDGVARDDDGASVPQRGDRVVDRAQAGIRS